MRHAEKLIEAVRVRPFLYDQNLQTFKHMGSKNRDWLEVAQIVYGREDRATVNKVKIQWKSLRDAFVKHQRKRQTATTKIRPYIYEEEMQFLLPHIQSRSREEYTGSSESLPISKFDVKTEESLNASLSEESAPAEELPVVEEFMWGETQREAEKEMHPVDAFFHGIAQTVKQLKPATVARVKKAVANVVMDAEIEELEKRGVE